MVIVEVNDSSLYILLPKKVIKKLDGLLDYVSNETDDFYIIEVVQEELPLLSEIVNVLITNLTSEGIDNLIQTLLLLRTQSEVSVVRKVFDLSDIYPELSLEVSVMSRFKIIVKLGEFREVLLNEVKDKITYEFLKEKIEPIFNNPENALFKIFVLNNYLFKHKGIVSSKFIKHFPDKLYNLGVYAVPNDKDIIKRIREKLIENIHILGSVYKEDINFEKVGVYASLVRKGCLKSSNLDKYTIVYIPLPEECKVHLNNNEKYLLTSIKTIFDDKVKKLSEITGLDKDEIKDLIYKKFNII